MPAWWEDPKLWITAGGLVAQAAILWWRVGEHSRDLGDVKDEQRGMAQDIDSLREWRAEARTDIDRLQQDVRDLTKGRDR
jgi:hypothetical protein